MRVKEIVELLNEQIRAGTVTEGNRLLPERELSQLLQVNRPALRQALAVMEVLGITEVRPRDGVYIKCRSSNLEQSLEFFSLWPADVIPQVYELRSILEPHAAELAAMRRDDENLKRMQETHQNMIRLASNPDEGSYIAFLRWNRMFHEIVIKAAKNQVLEQVYMANLAAYERAMIYMRQNDDSDRAYKWPLLTIEEHQRIITAIEEKDEKAAYALMKNHIKDGAMRAENFRGIVNVNVFSEA